MHFAFAVIAPLELLTQSGSGFDGGAAANARLEDAVIAAEIRIKRMMSLIRKNKSGKG